MSFGKQDAEVFEGLAHLAADLGEGASFPDGQGTRLGNVDVQDGGDPAGPAIHYDDLIGEEDRLADIVRDEQRRALCPLAQRLEFEIQFVAGKCVERRERFIHQQ